MAIVPDDDTHLVDLYANRGNADPFVVACALDGEQEDGQYLDPPERIVVTDDKAVGDKAAEFRIRVLANTEFAYSIDTVF